MTTQQTQQTQKSVVSWIGDVALWAGGIFLLSLCCGGAALAAFGVGTVLAVVLSPWFLIPAIIAGGYSIYRVRTGTCRGDDCDLCEAKVVHRAPRRPFRR